MIKIKKHFWGILIASVFFISGVLTLSDYGLNFDEPNHFMRGQALFRYLISGEKDYKNFVGRRSEWQYEGLTADHYLNVEPASHPTLNDIFASATNCFFYQRLGIIGDLESYHLFEVFISSLLVLLVYFIGAREYGVFAGIIAGLSMALYPLFLGESHFNIKDPIEASFFSFTLYFLYLGIEKLKSKFILLASVFFALALGTKFNVVFLPFIFVPYLLIKGVPILLKEKLNLIKIIKRIPRRIILSFLIFPLITVAIYLYFNPRLWADPIGRFLNEQVLYYKTIGLGGSLKRYHLGEWNIYPPFFVAISTPLNILILSVIGMFLAFKHRRRNHFSIILLSWLALPILRVMLPRASLHGGVRQIMEYIPAMAILAGLGGQYLSKSLIKLLKYKVLTKVFILSFFIPLIITMWRYHPNENVFINSLVGGLKGATEKKIPGTGETMGNSYLQGIKWLSQKKEKEIHLCLAVGLLSNIPRPALPSNIKIGPYSSTFLHHGEYMMEIFSVEFPDKDFNAQIGYGEKFLNPVHIVEIDGVPLLKIWKNDVKYIKPNFLAETPEKDVEVVKDLKNSSIRLKLKEPAFVTNLRVDLYRKNDCAEINKNNYGEAYYSLDGQNFNLMRPGLFYYNDYFERFQSFKKENDLYYFFPAVEANLIVLNLENPKSCLFQYKNIQLFSLRDLKPSLKAK